MRAASIIRTILAVAAMGTALGPGVRAVRAQVTLADDIIMAAQGKENAGKARDRQSPLNNRQPARPDSHYGHSPGRTDIILGADPNRRLTPLRRPSAALGAAVVIPLPQRGPIGRGHGVAPMIARMPASGDQAGERPRAESRSGVGAEAGRGQDPRPGPGPGRRPVEPPDEEDPDEPDDDGPAEGLTLDAAIDRLVHCNRELHTKFLELPQAQADILSAGLRENPLLFYSSDSVPYGSYSRQRPASIDHGISLVFPVDYTHKRQARVAVATREKQVLEAQYRDAVRLAIDDLYGAFVEALIARQATQGARRGQARIVAILRQAQARPRRSDAEDDLIDDMIIERDIMAMAVGDAEDRELRARRRLGRLLDLTPQEAEHLELHGSLRAARVALPSRDELIQIALHHRPDLAAYRLGVERSRAELHQERAERLSDMYLLYTPFEYRDNSPVGAQSAVGWGAGLFVSLPIFDRNQGNILRARIAVDQSHNEAAARQREVIGEVLQAVHDYEGTLADAGRLESETLPAVRRKRERARARLARGEISPAAFLDVQRDTTAIVRYHREILARHRHNTLRINTVLGMRLLP